MKVVESARARSGLAIGHTVFVEGALSLWFKASYRECNFWLTGHGPARIEGCNGPMRLDEMNEPDNTYIERWGKALLTLCPPVLREKGRATPGQSVNNARRSREA